MTRIDTNANFNNVFEIKKNGVEYEIDEIKYFVTGEMVEMKKRDKGNTFYVKDGGNCLENTIRCIELGDVELKRKIDLKNKNHFIMSKGSNEYSEILKCDLFFKLDKYDFSVSEVYVENKGMEDNILQDIRIDGIEWVEKDTYQKHNRLVLTILKDVVRNKENYDLVDSFLKVFENMGFHVDKSKYNMVEIGKYDVLRNKDKIQEFLTERGKHRVHERVDRKKSTFEV